MTTAYTNRLIVVIAADAQAGANAFAKQIDVAGGERTFTSELSPTGRSPATHYWCSWAMKKGEHDGLRTRLRLLVDSGKARVFDGNKLETGEILQQMGLKPVESERGR